jgi:cell division protein FtsW (lipid II flippase)
MTVTYVPALDRDARRAALAVSRIRAGDLLLILTSLVAVFAVGLSYAGRIKTFDLSERGRASTRIINLNTVADAAGLEPALESLLPAPLDRRFAARELFQFLLVTRGEGRELPNVGAVLSARVPLESIERGSRLTAYSERLALARERAVVAGRGPPRTVPLFTAADLATLKPHFSVRSRESFGQLVVLYLVVYVAGFHVVVFVWRRRGIAGDRQLLAAAHILTALGFAVLLSRPDPLRDILLFERYTQGVIVGLAVMALISLIDFRRAARVELSYLPLIGAFLLSALLILFGDGPGTSDAKVNLGPIQPIEAIRLLLALFLAGYFSRRWELLRQVRSDNIRNLRLPTWLNVTRAEYVLPVLVSVTAALAFFFFQKDLGPALILSCVFLATYAVARGRPGAAIAGLLVLVTGFYVGYRMGISQTLTERVRMWQSPWDNGVMGGDQIAQGIWGMSTGGLFGTGLGMGDTRYIPAGHTDLALAAVGEELGAAGLLVVAALYAVLIWRSVRIGRASPNDYGYFLALTITLFFVIPIFVMSAGVLGVMPLTGVVTPFLSYGGSAMTANFAALGILAAIGASRSSTGSLEPFRIPTLCVTATFGVGAFVLVLALLNTQVVRADDYVVRPQLSLQADGVRRYQYNPRLLDVVRLIPRGTIHDRNGLPLASEDAAVLARARNEYKGLGVSLDANCLDPTERCYPLGGVAFHLLGDARTRLNWSATNTSYVERDAEDHLRGFNDHATAVRTTDAAGRSAVAVRRDYRELIPLLRHRYEQDHVAVKTILTKARDLHLSVDAPFQARVASIIANYANRSTGGRAAAVVLDPDTGQMLAIASYPWPAPQSTRTKESGKGNDAFLDRARYGLYPPGSTFKLITAAAALGQDLTLGRTTFACTRLPDGRVGARIPGRGRPIRDDVLDTHPHGTIDMHDGMVQSCNAYFAQLAVKLGPEALLDVAARVGISLTPSNSLNRVRQTLPQAGYGQGDVLASPLRMARVAAAIASGGVIRETPLEMPPSQPARSEVLLPPDAARVMAAYLRDVIVSGTGRSLKDHAWRIAGKTGTAEVAGAPSHAWFVGFAPYGAASRRIAFAVIIENAGYGGHAAAPVAGEIVTAAASAQLIR